jgi:hypothetical protein
VNVSKEHDGLRLVELAVDVELGELEYAGSSHGATFLAASQREFLR